MQETLSRLLDSYIKFLKLTLLYEVINTKLKNYTKEHNGTAIIDYYALELKIVDKSIYTNDIIPYLKENNLNRFIKEKISENKISKLINLKILTNEQLIENIENEKTFLDIQLMHLDSIKEDIKKEFSKEVKLMDLKKCISKRESLKYEINESRYNYYKFAKQTKDFMSDINLYKYRFQYGSNIGTLEIRITSRTYKKKFISYLKDENLDVFEYYIDNQALLNSTNNKIDRNITEQFKIVNTKELLYVKILRGLYNKKIKKAKYNSNKEK